MRPVMEPYSSVGAYGQAFIDRRDTEAGAHHEIVAEGPGQAHAGLEVVPVLLVERGGVRDHADTAGDDVVRALRIETRHLPVLVVLRALHLVTNPEVQGQVASDFPVVLEVHRVHPIARQAAEQVLGDGVTRNRSDQQLLTEIVAARIGMPLPLAFRPLVPARVKVPALLSTV